MADAGLRTGNPSATPPAKPLAYWLLAAWVLFAVDWLLLGSILELGGLFAGLRIVAWTLTIWAVYRYKAPGRPLVIATLLIDVAVFALPWLSDLLPIEVKRTLLSGGFSELIAIDGWPAAFGVAYLFTMPLWLLAVFSSFWIPRKRLSAVDSSAGTAASCLTSASSRKRRPVRYPRVARTMGGASAEAPRR